MCIQMDVHNEKKNYLHILFLLLNSPINLNLISS